MLIASIRSPQDTLKPLDYLVGSEIKLSYQNILSIQGEAEYEREDGENYLNSSVGLDAKYLKSEFYEKRASGISLQSITLKYPWVIECSGCAVYLKTQSDMGLSLLFEDWKNSSGVFIYHVLSGTIGPMTISGESRFNSRLIPQTFKFRLDVLPKKRLSFTYKYEFFRGNPEFHWLLANVSLVKRR